LPDPEPRPAVPKAESMATLREKSRVWTGHRAKYGVEAGAVAGVSITENLTNLVKSIPKGYVNIDAVCEKLEDDLRKYLTGLAKRKRESDRKWIKWIETTFVPVIADLRMKLENDMKIIRLVGKSVPPKGLFSFAVPKPEEYAAINALNGLLKLDGHATDADFKRTPDEEQIMTAWLKRSGLVEKWIAGATDRIEKGEWKFDEPFHGQKVALRCVGHLTNMNSAFSFPEGNSAYWAKAAKAFAQEELYLAGEIKIMEKIYGRGL
jgi:hypothetical protein